MLPQIKLYIKKGIFFALCLFLLSSCLFEKEKESFLHVDDSPDQRYIPRLLYFSDGNTYYEVGDTLWLAGAERLQLTFSGIKVYGFEIRIGEELIASSEQNEPFYLEAKGRALGAHKLNLKVFVPAGTQSLADKLQAEYAAYNANIVLMITDPSTFKPEITSIIQKDGTVELKWKRYNGGNFQGYEIRKYKPGYGYADPYRTIKVTDQSQTTVNDTAYVGGPIWYAIAVNRAGTYIKSQDYKITFPYNPKMELSATANGKTRLTWQKPPYYNNIRSIKITTNPGVLYEADWTNQEYMEFNLDSPFGTLRDYNISFTGKVEDPGNLHGDKVSVSERLTLGKRIPSFDDVEYNSAEKAYYLIHIPQYYVAFDYPKGIYKLDKDLNIVDSVRHSESGNVVQSPDGNHLYLFDHYRARKIEKGPLRIGNIYWPETGSFQRFFLSAVFAVSNNNLLYFHDYYDYDNVVNPVTKEVLLKIKSTGASSLSPDGQYFIDGKMIYKFDGTTFVSWGSLPYFDDIYFVNFFNDNQRVLVATTDQAMVYNYATGDEEVKHSFSTPPNTERSFDPVTNKYVVVGSAINRIDIVTGEVEVITRPIYTSTAIKLTNDYLFSGAGFALKPYK
jgi:hypothetical protein